MTYTKLISCFWLVNFNELSGNHKCVSAQVFTHLVWTQWLHYPESGSLDTQDQLVCVCLFVCLFVCLRFLHFVLLCSDLTFHHIFCCLQLQPDQRCHSFLLEFYYKTKNKTKRKTTTPPPTTKLGIQPGQVFMALPLHSTTPTMHPHGIILIRFYAALLLPPGPETRLVMCMLWQGIALS